MSRRLFKERYIKAKSATVKSRFSFRSAFLSGYRKKQNKKTAAYSPRNEFMTGRRPRPEKVAKFKLQAAFLLQIANKQSPRGTTHVRIIFLLRFKNRNR